ncbi:MAG: FKBP-type peptidyl-prolyl cis-trans isomerase [Salinivirgaceae bacterium]|nr:FKBP-type peptidyl-prolyl cis-trans isomerase [Salinivirgaceae bacterium]
MRNFLSKINRNILIPIILFSLIVTIACSQNKNNRNTATPKQYKENLLQANKGLVDLDQDRIESYVKRRNWDMKVSETGMWYQIYDKKDGEKTKEKKIAHLKYQINLLDGTLCYTSDSLGVMKFKVGQGGVESGLEEAILLMGVGDKGRFIMPPHLAHGLLGDNNKIPPRSIIVYQTELIKLTNY